MRYGWEKGVVVCILFLLKACVSFKLQWHGYFCVSGYGYLGFGFSAPGIACARSRGWASVAGWVSIVVGMSMGGWRAFMGANG